MNLYAIEVRWNNPDGPVTEIVLIAADTIEEARHMTNETLRARAITTTWRGPKGWLTGREWRLAP